MGALAILVLCVVFVAWAALRGQVDNVVDEAIEAGDGTTVVAIGCGSVIGIIIAVLGAMIAIGMLLEQ